MTSLAQLQRRVSYLTYEIQNLPSNSGIQTINDISPDASGNFTIDPSNNILIQEDVSNNLMIFSPIQGRTEGAGLYPAESLNTYYGVGSFDVMGSAYTCAFGYQCGQQQSDIYSSGFGYQAGQNGLQKQACIFGAGTSSGPYACSYGFSSSAGGSGSVALGMKAAANANNCIVMSASGSGTAITNSTANSCVIYSIRNLASPLSNLMNYNPSTKEVFYSSGVIRSLGNTLSSVAPSTWNNGSSLTIPINSRFKVDVTIATNYSPPFSPTQSTPFIAWGLSLYTSSRYYGVTLGNVVSTNNYIVSPAGQRDASGNPVSLPYSVFTSDEFDLSSDSHTSVSICFYFLTWDDTNINTLNYSVVLTPI